MSETLPFVIGLISTGKLSLIHEKGAQNPDSASGVITRRTSVMTGNASATPEAGKMFPAPAGNYSNVD